jgi:hypothetical protein
MSCSSARDHQAVAVLVADLARERSAARWVARRAAGSARDACQTAVRSKKSTCARGWRSTARCAGSAPRRRDGVSTRPRATPTWLASRSTATASATSDSTAATTSASGHGSPPRTGAARGCATRRAPGTPRAPRTPRQAPAVALVVVALARARVRIVGRWLAAAAATGGMVAAFPWRGLGLRKGASWIPSLGLRRSIGRDDPIGMPGLVIVTRPAHRLGQARDRCGAASPRARAARRSRRYRARPSCRRSRPAPAGRPARLEPGARRRARSAASTVSS